MSATMNSTKQTGRSRVMIVDPEWQFGLKLADCLATNGYHAVLVRDLQSMLTELGEIQPEAILLSSDSQRSFMDLIYRIKSGDTGEVARRGMTTLARKLEAQGAEVIIAGCTEIPIVLTADDIEGELISSTDVLRFLAQR